MVSSELYPYLLAAVSRDNVLPLTSRCNLGCVFCSHRQNPPGVTTYRIPPLTVQTVSELIQFLDPARKVVIGESATRLNEGEPFTHPEAIPILRKLRRALPATLFSVTTNGTMLAESDLAQLAGLAPLELTVSLNSVTPFGRRLLLRDPHPQRATDTVRLLDKYQIPFHGSMVAMPHLTGWGDLDETVSFLAAAGALTVRVFLPGYTKLAPQRLRFPLSLWHELSLWTSRQTTETGIPVIPEPALCDNLLPQIHGVIRKSPAAAASLQPADIITSVSGKPVRTRVEAHRLAQKASNPQMSFERGGKAHSVLLKKNKGEPPGFVLHYDFDPLRMDGLAAEISRYRSRQPLLLCSVFACQLLKEVARKIGLPEQAVIPVENRFFGGSIQSAGLLTVEDLLLAAAEATASRPCDLILVPKEAFDLQGKDLRGQRQDELATRLGVPVCAV